MTVEITVYPALDNLGRRIEGHFDVWLDGDPLLKAVPDPLEATIVGDFNPRGNVHTVVEVRHQKTAQA